MILANGDFSLRNGSGRLLLYTGQLRYVKLAYLENPTCFRSDIQFPNIFSYVLLYFDFVCVELAYHRNLSYMEVIFIPVMKFSISFTTMLVLKS